jgi:hypothetical protein
LKVQFDFQTAAYICCSAPIATLLATFWIPESPIWLLQAGRYDDADEAIARMHRRESDFLQEVSHSRSQSYFNLRETFLLVAINFEHHSLTLNFTYALTHKSDNQKMNEN